MWTRFLLRPVEHTAAVAFQSVINIMLAALKIHLGPWAGGWLFTVTYVAFWWLVLDQMYHRKIFWKL